ncbi:mitoferrin-1 [Anabrus simplex]|uniref:mitoferrin-1 n=1 Tax=Anabrus simplex TaxID=316456 RepID=UPI0034DD2CB3
MDIDEYETLPTKNVTVHMTAGAVAGVMEHCVMYPLDSVKTRMQNLSPSPNAVYRGVGEALFRMVKHEGVLRPVRGMSAVVMGAGPAHALYFSCYEFSKDFLTQTSLNNHIAIGVSGCVATLLHDGVMNPAEVVKQRIQMYNSPYKSCWDCFVKVLRNEGGRAFYRSYTTQLTMNVPFQSIHFMTYEFAQGITNPERQYNPRAHVVSGAIAGAFAAAVTTPLDVCKTLLNTQPAMGSSGLVHAIRTVYKLGGPTGFFRGIKARILYQMPSTAICWSMYEFFKYFLTQHNNETGKNAESSGTVVTSLPLRLVVPQASLAGETSEHQRTCDEKGNGNSETWDSRGSGSSSITVKTRELPSVSGAGLYGALSFNTVHSADATITQSNALLDVTHS